MPAAQVTSLEERIGEATVLQGIGPPAYPWMPKDGVLDRMYRATSPGTGGQGVFVRDRGAKNHFDAACPMLLRMQWEVGYRLVVLEDEITSNYVPYSCSVSVGRRSDLAGIFVG